MSYSLKQINYKTVSESAVFRGCKVKIKNCWAV